MTFTFHFADAFI